MITASQSARGQASSPLPSVQLRWQGSSTCAEPTRVLEAAAELVAAGSGPSNSAPMAVTVQLQDDPEGSVAMVFAAEVAGRRAHRALTLPSCDDARQTTALLIALTLDPDAPTAEPPVAAPATAAAGPESEPPAPAAPAATTQPEPAAAPKPAIPAAPAAPSTPRSGLGLGLAGGLAVLSPSPVTPVLTARVGYRWQAFELEASGTFWLPAHDDVDGADLAVDMAGGAATLCHGFGRAAWELAPCLGFELVRVHAEIDDEDASAKVWARATLGPRLQWWLSKHAALSLAADGVLSLHRPRLPAGDGRSARAPAAGFVSRVGLTYWLGTRSDADAR